MRIHRILNYLIAIVWLVNGLLCKVLHLVPRHEQIVGSILGVEHAKLLTKTIGVGEIAMAIWIVSGIKPQLNAATQIIIIAAMNIIEFFIASDLLLWGHLNIVFALMFIVIIYYNSFVLNKKLVQNI